MGARSSSRRLIYFAAALEDSEGKSTGRQSLMSKKYYRHRQKSIRKNANANEMLKKPTSLRKDTYRSWKNS